MTKHIAGQYSTQQIRDFLALSNIKAGDWDTLIRVKHLLWARFTSVWGGHAFDPVWTNTGTSQSFASNSTARGLDEAGIGGVAERKIDGDNVTVGVIVAAVDATVNVDIENLDTNTTLASGLSASTSVAGDTEWLTISTTFPYSNVTDSNDDPEFLRAEVTAAHNGDGTQAEVFGIYGGELETSSGSDIPDGL